MLFFYRIASRDTFCLSYLNLNLANPAHAEELLKEVSEVRRSNYLISGGFINFSECPFPKNSCRVFSGCACENFTCSQIFLSRKHFIKSVMQLFVFISVIFRNAVYNEDKNIEKKTCITSLGLMNHDAGNLG